MKDGDDEQGDLFGGGWDTLGVARRKLMALLDEGSVCPCCDQYARRYVRSIYSSQCRQLIRLFQMNNLPGEALTYWHRTKVVPYANNGDLVFLRHWTLLEVEPNEDPAKKDSGKFRITELGREFVLKKVRVPKSLLQYNDKVEGFSEKTTDIEEALGKDWNYEDLLNAEL